MDPEVAAGGLLLMLRTRALARHALSERRHRRDIRPCACFEPAETS
jgi:hypothetical protein